MSNADNELQEGAVIRYLN